MNLIQSLRVVIIASLMLITSCICCLGSMPDGFDQFHIGFLPDSSLESDLRELYSHQLESGEIIAFLEMESTSNYSKSLSDYEGRLRDRAIKLAHIEAKMKEVWPELNVEERIDLTGCLEDLLRHQAVLLSDFQSYLKKVYCLLPVQDKRKFLNSFVDLLDREATLLMGFEDFLHHLQNAPEEDQIEFLASFEDLIRRQAILLEIYEDLLKVNCNILKIYKYVDRCGCHRSGQNITYTYVIKNTGNCTIEGIKIADSRMGVIIEGVSLGPYETKSFNKSTVLNSPHGPTVCNTARAWGIDPNNFTIMSESNEVCIRMCTPTINQESLELGNQKALAIATDPATAENNIVIKKNQNGKCCENENSANQMAIRVGDQVAAAYRSSKGGNNIKIVSNQQ